MLSCVCVFVSELWWSPLLCLVRAVSPKEVYDWGGTREPQLSRLVSTVCLCVCVCVWDWGGRGRNIRVKPKDPSAVARVCFSFFTHHRCPVGNVYAIQVAHWGYRATETLPWQRSRSSLIPPELRAPGINYMPLALFKFSINQNKFLDSVDFFLNYLLNYTILSEFILYFFS